MYWGLGVVCPTNQSSCHQLEKEAQYEAEQRRFRAQGDDVVHKPPFIPEKSKKPLTEISNVALNTEIRASERSEYENQQKALEEERMAAKKMVGVCWFCNSSGLPLYQVSPQILFNESFCMTVSVLACLVPCF